MTFEDIVIFTAEHLHFIVVAIAGFVFLGYRFRNLQKQIVLTAIISGVLALGIDKLLNQLIDSPRPFVVDGIVPLFSHVADNGFPSEHTLFATVIAGIVFLYQRKIGSLLLLFALLIGIARIFAGVHHLKDVLGGIFIAVLAVYVAQQIVSKIVTSQSD